MHDKNALLNLAKELRKNMTPQERRLWYVFLSKRPEKWYKQRIIDHYISDFYCASAKLVIELDGSQHYYNEQLESDNERTRILNQYGLQVLRYSNFEINESFDEVCDQIDRIVREKQSNIK